MVKINNISYYNTYDLIQKKNLESSDEHIKFFDSVRLYSKDIKFLEKSVNVEVKRFFMFYLLTECFPKLTAQLNSSQNINLKSKEDIQKSNQSYTFEIEFCNSETIKEALNFLYIESLNKNILSNCSYFIGDNIFKLSIPVKHLISIEEISKLFKIESNNYVFVFEFRCTGKKLSEKEINLIFPFWNIIHSSKRIKKNII